VQIVFKVLYYLVENKVNIKLLVATWETFTYSEYCSESRIRISVPVSFRVIGRFTPVNVENVIAGFQSNFQVKCGFRNNN
jgi:hypothetical protein